MHHNNHPLSGSVGTNRRRSYSVIKVTWFPITYNENISYSGKLVNISNRFVINMKSGCRGISLCEANDGGVYVLLDKFHNL